MEEIFALSLLKFKEYAKKWLRKRFKAYINITLGTFAKVFPFQNS